MSPEQNKHNADTPSFIPLEQQFLYRLASLEATVNGSFKRLDEKFDVIRSEVSNKREETAKEISEIRTKVNILEKWQHAVTVRVSVILGGFGLFWTLFGYRIQAALGG